MSDSGDEELENFSGHPWTREYDQNDILRFSVTASPVCTLTPNTSNSATPQSLQSRASSISEGVKTLSCVSRSPSAAPSEISVRAHTPLLLDFRSEGSVSPLVESDEQERRPPGNLSCVVSRESSNGGSVKQTKVQTIVSAFLQSLEKAYSKEEVARLNRQRSWIIWRPDGKLFNDDGSQATDWSASSWELVPSTKNLAEFFGMNHTSMTFFVRKTAKDKGVLFPLIGMKEFLKKGQETLIWLMQSYEPRRLVPADHLELVLIALRVKTPNDVMSVVSIWEGKRAGALTVDRRVMW